MSRNQSPIEMSAEEFRQCTFVLPVRRVSGPRGRKIDVSASYQPLFGRLEQVVTAGLLHESAFAPLLIDRLMSVDLQDDLYWSALADGTMLVLVEESVYEQVGERRLVEEVHAAELEHALKRGEEVSSMDLVRFYRSQPPALTNNTQVQH